MIQTIPTVWVSFFFSSCVPSLFGVQECPQFLQGQKFSYETPLFQLSAFFELNHWLLSIQEQKELSLSEIELSRLAAIAKVLKETSFYHTSKLADADMTLLLKMLKSWPTQMMFPGTCFSLEIFNWWSLKQILEICI